MKLYVVVVNENVVVVNVYVVVVNRTDNVLDGAYGSFNNISISQIPLYYLICLFGNLSIFVVLLDIRSILFVVFSKS